MEKLVSSLRSEIRSITEEPVWDNRRNRWSRRKNHGDPPDYLRIRKQFQSLARQGNADALLELGEELLERWDGPLEESDDSEEEELRSAVADCMGIVIRSVPKSSLNRLEQLLWAIGIESTDAYGILEKKYFDFMKSDGYSRADWREVAENLESRLSAMSDEWYRSNFVYWLLHAYRLGGLEERMISLLEREGDYVGLVDALLEQGKREEARRNCILGYEKILEAQGFASRELHERLLKMAEAEGRFDLAAAYCWDDFCDEPTDESYVRLRDSAEKARCWPAVREAALRFLRIGSRPDRAARKAVKQNWPLPPTEVAHLNDKIPAGLFVFPLFRPLVRIAILEKRVDDVVELHRKLIQKPDHSKRPLIIDSGIMIDIANAVSGKYPDVALSCWRYFLDALIGHAEPAFYNHLMEPLLRNMKSLYEKTNRLGEWTALISELRVAHHLDNRLLEVLAAVE
ncbi:MAG: hypothetical protein LBS00_10565 [Synergistaceae bacterium]|jgi:uncharacterized Zn finger protein|nr:hypothetical protein [Synergistaceae bacterium]